MRRSIGIIDFTVLLAAFVIVFQQLDGFADDPGLGWHLRSGSWMWMHGSLPESDPFLASTSPRAWIHHQWLSDLFLHIPYQAGGFPLLYAIFTCVYLSLFFGVLPKVLKDRSVQPWAGSLALFVAFRLALVQFMLRPVVFGMLFFAIVFRLIATWQRDRDVGGAPPPLLSLRTLGMLLVFLVWANLHPSFILGFCMIGVFTVALLVDRYRTGEKCSDRDWIRYALQLFLLSIAVTFVNPYGWRLHLGVIELQRSTLFLSLNQEWQPLRMESPEGQLFGIAVIVMLAAQFFSKRSSKVGSSFFFLLLLGLALGSLRMVRLLPYFAIVSVLPLSFACEQLAGLFSDTRLRIVRRLERLSARWVLRYGGIWQLGLYFIILFLTVASGLVPGFRGHYGPSRVRYPYQAIEALCEHGKEAVVAASPDVGGFITLAGFPTVRAVVDDRNELLGEQPYREYLDWLGAGGVTRPVWGGEPATHLLLPAHSFPAMYRIIMNEKQGADPRIVFMDDRYVVFRLQS